MTASRYEINEKSVVFDVLDGEAVVVNLDTGAYYIFEGSASAIWQMLAASHTAAEIGETLSQHYTGEAAAIASAAADFSAQLAEEALIAPADAGRIPAPFDSGQLAGRGQPFTVPVMYRYTDMQALIQMDPIREYDETGWPRRPAPPSSDTE